MRSKPTRPPLPIWAAISAQRCWAPLSGTELSFRCLAAVPASLRAAFAPQVPAGASCPLLLLLLTLLLLCCWLFYLANQQQPPVPCLSQTSPPAVPGSPPRPCAAAPAAAASRRPAGAAMPPSRHLSLISCLPCCPAPLGASRAGAEGHPGRRPAPRCDAPRMSRLHDTQKSPAAIRTAPRGPGRISCRRTFMVAAWRPLATPGRTAGVALGLKRTVPGGAGPKHPGGARGGNARKARQRPEFGQPCGQQWVKNCSALMENASGCSTRREG